jgi:hypothetical protein
VSGVVRQRFSYRYESVPFAWNDISDGTRYALTVKSSVTIPIGFSFTFFGTAFSNVTISSNGFLAFNAANTTSFGNPRIPTIGSPNGIVAPFWDDLNPGVGGSVYSKLEGVAPNRRLTVSWVGVPHFSAGGAVSFQAILREGSDDILFQYQDVVFGTAGYDFGANATVGVENMEGNEGTQFSFNQPSLSGATAFRWYPGPFNHRPVANAGGPYKALVGQSLSFNGSGSSDPDGDTLTYRWDFGDGTTGTGVSPVHTYKAKGTYSVSLVVNDGVQDSAAAATTVAVPNQPPVADAGPDMTVRSRDKVILASRSLDPDGVIAALHWRQVSGTPVTITNPDPDPRSGSASFTAPNVKPGTQLLLEFELTATDNDGASASDRAIVTVVK